MNDGTSLHGSSIWNLLIWLASWTLTRMLMLDSSEIPEPDRCLQTSRRKTSQLTDLFFAWWNLNSLETKMKNKAATSSSAIQLQHHWRWWIIIRLLELEMLVSLVGKDCLHLRNFPPRLLSEAETDLSRDEKEQNGWLKLKPDMEIFSDHHRHNKKSRQILANRQRRNKNMIKRSRD